MFLSNLFQNVFRFFSKIRAIFRLFSAVYIVCLDIIRKVREFWYNGFNKTIKLIETIIYPHDENAIQKHSSIFFSNKKLFLRTKQRYYNTSNRYSTLSSVLKRKVHFIYLEKSEKKLYNENDSFPYQSLIRQSH